MLMRTFREYVDSQDYNDIKLIMLNILDPQSDTVDPESKSIVTRPLSDFKRRNKLLTDPSLSAIIRRRANRGAILQAIKNDGTTIGNLLAMLTEPLE